MIWDPAKTAEESGSELASHVADEIASLCGKDLCQDREKINELAHAIDRYLRIEGAPGPVSSKYLLTLASRALNSIGEEKAARKLFIFGTGMAVPSEWTVSRGDSMLILDLRRMTVHSDANLEIVFFSSLNMALEAIADFWDDSQGRGVLGLRHICLAADALLGEPQSKKETDALVGEIMAACREKMEQVHGVRGWTDVPEVMDLDMGGG